MQRIIINVNAISDPEHRGEARAWAAMFKHLTAHSGDIVAEIARKSAAGETLEQQKGEAILAVINQHAEQVREQLVELLKPYPGSITYTTQQEGIA